MVTIRRSACFFAIGLAMQAPTIASACQIGERKILFIAAPSPDIFPGAEIIRVHFTNVGAMVDQWRRRAPKSNYGILIGVARILNGKHSGRSGYFPVYATITSCTPSFMSMVSGDASPVWNGTYYIAGRFLKSNDSPGFQAEGYWNPGVR